MRIETVFFSLQMHLYLLKAKYSLTTSCGLLLQCTLTTNITGTPRDIADEHLTSMTLPLAPLRARVCPREDLTFSCLHLIYFSSHVGSELLNLFYDNVETITLNVHSVN